MLPEVLTFKIWVQIDPLAVEHEIIQIFTVYCIRVYHYEFNNSNFQMISENEKDVVWNQLCSMFSDVEVQNIMNSMKIILYRYVYNSFYTSTH